MIEQKNELADWVLEYKAKEKEKTTFLTSEEVYGKGVSSIFPDVSGFDGPSPSYNITQIDKELELYTLLEASNTDGVGDILKGILNSALIPESTNRIESMIKAGISSGLVVYVQPKMTEEGELLEHNIFIETSLPIKGASDTLVIIAKTGARLNITHEFNGGLESSLLGRHTIIICEDGGMVKFKESIKNERGSLYLKYVSLVGPASNVTFSATSNSSSSLRIKSDSFLLGEGSNCSSDYIFIAKDKAKYDISNTAHLKTPTAHASLHSVCAAYDESHLIYRDGIISLEENNGSVDEAKLLLVGENSRIDTLPVKESNAMRHVSQSHLDSASDVELKQFFGRIVNQDLLDETLKSL